MSPVLSRVSTGQGFGSIVSYKRAYLASQGGGAYQISRSLRFNSADSAYLNRTPAGAGNRTTWTWAGWIKRATLGTGQTIFSAIQDGNNGTVLRISNVDCIEFLNYVSGAYAGRRITSAVYRDPSAWYHIVLAWDSTNGTAANRIRLYVNGSEVTVFSTTGDPASANSFVNSTNIHYLGADLGFNNQYLPAYLADVHFIDGQALTPSSFTETSLLTGQLIPKTYSGSYGTNGFKLNFSSNASTAALGTDSSGNNNTWAVNNFSVTAGAGNDSLVDTPTSYGTDTGVGAEVRGNYATLNPLDNSSGMTLANGNLDGSETGGGHKGTRATIKFPSSGKWYYEGTVTTLGGACCIGAATNAAANPDINASGSYYILVNSSGNVQRYQSFASYTGFDTPAVGTILRVAYDADAQKLWLGLNALWMNGSNGTTGDPATGANATFSSITDIYPAIDQQTSAVAVNFGQRAFAYTAPSGFKALVDTNLTAPAIVLSNTAFDTKLYTGNGSTQTISGLAFSPDLIWTKSRSQAYSHNLYDSVRGIHKNLFPNETSAENTDTNTIQAFNSDGFQIGSNDNGNYTNGGSAVAWTWDAGTSTVTNTAGSITSQVRANASAGFSVCTFTQPSSSSSFSWGHGLNVAPQLAIMKPRDSSGNWQVYHASTGAQYIWLNSTNAATGTGWSTVNSSIVTSTATLWQGSNVTTVAYCFAPVSGYSSFGSFTGNGSSNGVFVYTGMRPRFLLTKRTDSAESWLIHDTARNQYNVADLRLRPNSSDAEATVTTVDILSNGFKLRTGNSGEGNDNGATYIYAAFAESPLQYSRAR